MNARTALVLGLGIGAHLVACGGSAVKPAYSPAQAKACAAIEARYAEAVTEACYGKYAFDDCPDVPALKVHRLAEQKDSGCR
jgi:hypothetical protein